MSEEPLSNPASEVPADLESPAPNWPRREAPAVSVIIPHYDDLDNLRRRLSLLAAQTMPRDAFEIVVADNNSSCGIATVEKACASLARVVPAPIQGAAEARNAGVMASRGRRLAFIDSDCRPVPEWIERGIKALDDADMVGGSVDVDVLDADNPTAVEAFEMVFAFNFKRYAERQGFSGSGNMFVSRAIFDKVGGFRGGVPEDLDWGHRALALGCRWRYAPDPRLAHPARRDWADLTRKWRRLVDEAYAAVKEKPFGKLRRILRSWLVLLSPFFHTAAVLRSNKLNRFDLRLKAIVVLFRPRCWRFWKSHVVLFPQA